MKKYGIYLLAGLVVISVLLSSWILDIYTQKRILAACQRSKETISKIIYGYYRNYVDSLNDTILNITHSLLLKNDLSQLGLERLTQEIKVNRTLTPILHNVWWLSPEGEVLYSDKDLSQNMQVISSDPMFSAAQEGGVYSDLYSDVNKVYMVTLCPVALHQKQYVLAIETKFGDAFVREMHHVTHEDIALLYGRKMFASSNPSFTIVDFTLSETFLNAVRDKQEAGSQTIEYEGHKYLVTAFPISDYDEWNTKGFVVLLYPKASLQQAIGAIRQRLWLGMLFSSLLLVAGVSYILKWTKRKLTAKSKADFDLNRRSKRRMLLLAGLLTIPVIAVFIYVSFSPVPALLSTFNSDRIRTGAYEVKSVVNKWEESLTKEYSLGNNNGVPVTHGLVQIKNQGGFDFVVWDGNGAVKRVGTLPCDYSTVKNSILRLSENIPNILPCNRGALFLAKTTTTSGLLIYGFSITKDSLATMGERAAADITIFANESLAVSTVEPRVLRTLKLSSSPIIEEGIIFKRGKLRDIYHEMAFIPLISAEGENKDLKNVLMVSMDDTPFQNNIVGYHFLVFVLILVIMLIAEISFFVILNIDRPLFLRSVFTGYAFLSPALVHLFWWAVGPLLFAIYLAFHHWSIISPAKPFVGFGNFIELMHDGLFWRSMLNTAIYTLQVPIGMALSLAIALAVNRKVRGIRLLRTVYYLPAVSSLVVTSIMWRWIYNPDFGILNYLLGFLGIPKLPWLTSPYMAMPAIMIMSIWMVMGQQMIIFLAGLQSIPPEYYDAASVDGANTLQRFWYITLPLLKPTTFFVLVTSVISSFQVFTPIYVLTKGGPVGSTDVAVYHIWQAAWQELRMGYAAAESWILFAVIVVFTLVEFRLLGKEVRYV